MTQRTFPKIPPSTCLRAKKASLVLSKCFYFLCIITEIQKWHLINLKASAFLQLFLNSVSRITTLFGCPICQYCCHFPQATVNSSNRPWKHVAVELQIQGLPCIRHSTVTEDTVRPLSVCWPGLFTSVSWLHGSLHQHNWQLPIWILVCSQKIRRVF